MHGEIRTKVLYWDQKELQTKIIKEEERKEQEDIGMIKCYSITVFFVFFFTVSISPSIGRKIQYKWSKSKKKKF